MGCCRAAEPAIAAATLPPVPTAEGPKIILGVIVVRGAESDNGFMELCPTVSSGMWQNNHIVNVTILGIGPLDFLHDR